MKTLVAGIVMGLLATTASPASASVTYELDAFLAGFRYQAPGFIDSLTRVDGSATDYCGVFIASCQSLVFEPGTPLERTQDRVTLNVVIPFLSGAAAEPFPVTFSFAQGAFGRDGTYKSTDQWAKLVVSGTVSAVPLPASASLFGAAILGLGIAGVRRNRRTMPA